ncbi:MAG: hypothetical protein OXI83_01745 [Gemmatimonadota bacterium]|nr:hypothetical protein [Gemmatimonadota bacterium]
MPRKETSDRPDFRRKRPQPPNWWQRMAWGFLCIAVIAGTFYFSFAP